MANALPHSLLQSSALTTSVDSDLWFVREGSTAPQTEAEDKDKPGPGAYDITEKRPLRWDARPGGKRACSLRTPLYLPVTVL